MTPTRRPHRHARRIPKQITTLLRSLDIPVPASGRGKRGFWLQYEHDLHGILADAREKHRQHIVRVHPDKPGGCAQAAAYVNATWQRIQLLFSRKGITL